MTRPEDDERTRRREEREFLPAPHQLRFVRWRGESQPAERLLLSFNGQHEWPSLHVARAMAEQYLQHERPDAWTLVLVERLLGAKRVAVREAWAWSPLAGARRVLDYHDSRVA